MIPKMKTALVAVSGLLLLTGCGATGSAPLAEYLEKSDEEDVVIASLADVYGADWDTFYVVCPESELSTAAQLTGVSESDLPDLATDGSDNAIVYTVGDDAGYELFEVTDVQLCSGNMAPLPYEITTDLISISPAVNSDWWLTSRDLAQAGN